MLTTTEMQKILDQLNKRFDYLNNKIEQLEKAVATPKRTPTPKKAEEKA